MVIKSLCHKTISLLFCNQLIILSFQNNLTELKSFGSPPAAVLPVTAAVMVLLAPGGKVPKDRSWKAAKLMMAKVSHCPFHLNRCFFSLSER